MISGRYHFEQFVLDLQHATGNRNLSNRLNEIRDMMIRGERLINPYGSVLVRKKMKLYVGNGNFDGTRFKLEEDYMFLDKVGCCDEGLCEGAYRNDGRWITICDGEPRTEVTYVYWAIRLDQNGNPFTTYNHSEALIKFFIWQWKQQEMFYSPISLAKQRAIDNLEANFEDHAAFARGEDYFPSLQALEEITLDNRTRMEVLHTKFDRGEDGCLECSCVYDGTTETDPNDEVDPTPDNTAPTVGDNSAPLQVEDYQFSYASFTEDYFDAENHLPGKLVIRSLPDPTFGRLYRNAFTVADSTVEVGSEYDINESDLLFFELNQEIYIAPDGSMIRFTGENIYQRIEDLLTDGYTQRADGCNLEFSKTIETDIPNDADLYFFIDTTDIPVDDGEVLADVIAKWYEQFKIDNDSFTGEYYIMPFVNEQWLRHGVVPRSGAWDGYTETYAPPTLTATDLVTIARWQGIAKTPAGLNTRDFVPSDNAVVFSFCDESHAAYHSAKLSDGFSTVVQPSANYVNDYLDFTSVHTQYNFFKGIVIPVVTDVLVQQGAFCLHAVAAIEGEQLSSGEITAINCPADLSLLETENPYENFAITGFPNMTGLKNVGWEYNVENAGPHEDVYTNAIIHPILDAMLATDGDSSTDVITLNGSCLPNDSICFNFAVKEQSDDELQSNDASFCFNVELVDVPTLIWAFQFDDIGTPGQTHATVTQAWIQANGIAITEADLLAGTSIPFTGIGRIGFAVQTGTQNRYDIYQFNLDVTDKFDRQFNVGEQLDVYLSDGAYSPGNQLIEFKNRL